MGGEPLPPAFAAFERAGIILRRAEVTVIAGTPGAGKSSIALAIAARTKLPTLYFSSIIAMAGINFVAVKVFGEFEFWFSLIKVVAIICMIAIGCAMIFFGLGNAGEPIGMANLWQHGGIFPNGVSGFLLSLQMVLFAYVGIEMIGLSAGEAENPTKTIPMAIDSLAWRILIFYVGALFVIMAIFPWHQVGQQGSPFVAMFESMGLREAAGVINFVVITAALSSCNAGLFSGGRLLLGLSKVGNAPKIFSELSTAGVDRKSVV